MQVYFHERGRFGMILLTLKTTLLRGRDHRGRLQDSPKELRADPANCKSAGGWKGGQGHGRRIRSTRDLR